MQAGQGGLGQGGNDSAQNEQTAQAGWQLCTTGRVMLTLHHQPCCAPPAPAVPQRTCGGGGHQAVPGQLVNVVGQPVVLHDLQIANEAPETALMPRPRGQLAPAQFRVQSEPAQHRLGKAFFEGGSVVQLTSADKMSPSFRGPPYSSGAKPARSLNSARVAWVPGTGQLGCKQLPRGLMDGRWGA